MQFTRLYVMLSETDMKAVCTHVPTWGTAHVLLI